MGINTDLILAGISGGGASGAELCFVAPVGASAPVDATSALALPTNEVQTVTITGGPTGGTFTLSFGGQTTSGIAYNATASAVQTALRALSSVGPGGVTVSGGPGPATPYVVNFTGALAAKNAAQMTAVGTFTGGSTPAIAVTTTTPGVAGWFSPGLVTEDGLEKAVENSSNDIKAFGLSSVARKIVTDETITFKIQFLETNTVSLAVYNRLPLGGIVPDSNGDFSITEGTFRAQRYAMAFDAVDGDNAIRIYAPSVEITERGNQKISNGEAFIYEVTATAYANSIGVSAETFYHVPLLAAA